MASRSVNVFTSRVPKLELRLETSGTSRSCTVAWLGWLFSRLFRAESPIVMATPTCNVGNSAATAVDDACGCVTARRALFSGLKLSTSSLLPGGLDGVRRPARGGLLLPPGRELERVDAPRGCAAFLLAAVGTVCTAGFPTDFAGVAGAGADAFRSGDVGVTITGDSVRATGTTNPPGLGVGCEDLGDLRPVGDRTRAALAGDAAAAVFTCTCASLAASLEDRPVALWGCCVAPVSVPCSGLTPAPSAGAAPVPGRGAAGAGSVPGNSVSAVPGRSGVVPPATGRPGTAGPAPDFMTPDWSFHHHSGLLALGTPLPAAGYARDATPRAPGATGDTIARAPGVGGVGAGAGTEQLGRVARDTKAAWDCVRIIGALDLTLQATAVPSADASDNCRAGVAGR
mmetsp:Transcript_36173/g.94736  ORF Transcript_36173/g.94736 Transcript_36173/m.94736 type:complete len:399 (-) Transcript_36173:552-1748(-)